MNTHSSLLQKLSLLIKNLSHQQLKQEIITCVQSPSFSNTLLDGEHAEFIQLIVELIPFTPLSLANTLLDLIEELLANGYVRHASTKHSLDVCDDLLNKLFVTSFPTSSSNSFCKCIASIICIKFTDTHGPQLKNAFISLFKRDHTDYHNNVINTICGRYRSYVLTNNRQDVEDVMMFVSAISTLLQTNYSHSLTYFTNFISQLSDIWNEEKYVEHIKRIIDIIAPFICYSTQTEIVELWIVIIKNKFIHMFPILGICVKTIGDHVNRNTLTAVNITLASGLLPSLFVFYDCQVGRENIVEYLIEIVCRGLKENSSVAGGILSEMLRGISILPSENESKMLIECKTTKNEIEQHVKEFNEKGTEVISILIEKGYLKPEATSIVQFLKSDEFQPKVVGSILCKNNDLWKGCLEQYIKQLDLRDIELDQALHQLFYHFEMVGESQIVERVMHNFCLKYLNDNQRYKEILTTEQVEQFATTLLILATESHNQNCKLKCLDTYDKFQQIITNDFNIQYNEKLLIQMYRRVQTIPFISRTVTPISRPACISYHTELFQELKNPNKQVLSILFDFIWNKIKVVIDCSKDYSFNIAYNALQTSCLLQTNQTHDISKMLLSISNSDLSRPLELHHIVCIDTIINTIVEKPSILGSAWGSLLNVIFNIEALNYAKDDISNEISTTTQTVLRIPRFPKQFNINFDSLHSPNLKELIELNDPNNLSSCINNALSNNCFASSIRYSDTTYYDFILGILEAVQYQIHLCRVAPLEHLVQCALMNKERDHQTNKKVIQVIVNWLQSCSFHPSQKIALVSIDALRQIIVAYEMCYDSFIPIISDCPNHDSRLHALTCLFECNIPDNESSVLYSGLISIPDRSGSIIQEAITLYQSIYKKYPSTNGILSVYQELINDQTEIPIVEKALTVLSSHFEETTDSNVRQEIIATISRKIDATAMGMKNFEILIKYCNEINDSKWLGSLFNNRDDEWNISIIPLLIKNNSFQKWNKSIVSYMLYVLINGNNEVQKIVIDNIKYSCKYWNDEILQLIPIFIDKFLTGLIHSNESQKKLLNKVSSNTCFNCHKIPECFMKKCPFCLTPTCKECEIMFDSHKCCYPNTINEIDNPKLHNVVNSIDCFSLLMTYITTVQTSRKSIHSCLANAIHGLKKIISNKKYSDIARMGVLQTNYVSIYTLFFDFIFNSYEINDDYGEIVAKECDVLFYEFIKSGCVANIAIPKLVLEHTLKQIVLIRDATKFYSLCNTIFGNVIEMVMSNNNTIRSLLLEIMRRYHQYSK
ncbi:SEC7 domain-containing protein [Entamoeba marina]